jgi:glycosyltransferase involved in cell wall biosynthesis
MVRFHDCSNSSQRPAHRGGGGPVVNDVMRLLREHAGEYGFEHVDSPEGADVVITNDVFPGRILSLGKPLVKRMDGVFWQEGTLERNLPYVQAAKKAGHVVFISEYSRWKFEQSFGSVGGSVALNWVDPEVFKPSPEPSGPSSPVAISVATSWDRPEKRGEAILSLARKSPLASFVLVGKANHWFKSLCPQNVRLVGYVEGDRQIADELLRATLMVNLSHRDPAPKVVAQAVACGLPVLYANTGGTPELVYGERDMPLCDLEAPGGEVPPLFPFAEDTIKFVTSVREGLSGAARERLEAWSRRRFKAMLGGYFKAMASVL